MRTIPMLILGVALFLVTDSTEAAPEVKGKKGGAKGEIALFDKIDTNNDGQISKAEFAKYEELKKAKMAAAKAKKVTNK